MLEAIWLSMLTILVLGYLAWLIIITVLYKPNGNTEEIINTTIVYNDTYINTSMIGVVSQVYLGSSTINISNSVNVPFDMVVSDPFSLYNTSSYSWTTDRRGYWDFDACVIFDETDIPPLPTNLTYDFQLQMYVDGSFPGNAGAFLFVLTEASYGIIPNAVQKMVCGTNTFLLNASQTLSMRVQTRIYPLTVVPSALTGGAFSATRATFKFVGEIP